MAGLLPQVRSSQTSSAVAAAGVSMKAEAVAAKAEQLVEEMERGGVEELMRRQVYT